MFLRFCCTILALLTVAGCAKYDSDYKLPGVYRIDVQQGNVIEQDMLDKLKPGMDKNQVRFIMGTPAVEDPFHNDRWDYVYTITKGASRRKQRHITLYFQDEKLAYIEGGVVEGMRTPPEELKRPSKTVDVPLKKHKKAGFFSRVFNALPFIGEEEPPPPSTRNKKSEDSESP